MVLKSIFFQNFRNYNKSEFNFSKDLNFIVGQNTSGKTNLLEAIYLLSKGKSFKTLNDLELIKFGENLARVSGSLASPRNHLRGGEAATSTPRMVEELASDSLSKLEVLIRNPQNLGQNIQAKKFLVNGVSKRKPDFEGNLPIVLFSPVDVEIIVGSPHLRRELLDDVLTDESLDYGYSLSQYRKALRQRNKLLEKAKEEGKRYEEEFEYWDNLLIEKGTIVSQKREKFIDFVNKERKDIFEFKMFYDKSEISKERLNKYKEAESSAGVTLVGPHRDDFWMRMDTNENSANEGESVSRSLLALRVETFVKTSSFSVDVRSFGSRGQQRLAILQLKVLQLLFLQQSLGFSPLLLLDDIFSELDEVCIKHVLRIIEDKNQQSIITTTHKEFIGSKLTKDGNLIELKSTSLS